MTDKPQFDGKKVKVKLADVCTLTMGQSPSSNSYNEIGNGIPFFQGNADFGEEAPVPRVWCTDPKKTAEGGDLLISVRAPIGAVNMAVERCCIGRGVAAIHPNDDSISVDFLKHQLLSKRRELETMGTGSTFKAVGKKSLGNLTLVLYPEDTQHEIERCLNQIKKQIKAISSQSSKLDSLVKSRFVEMFGNDKLFQARQMGQLFSGIVSGTNVSGKQRSILPGEFAVLKISAVTKGFFKPNEYKVVDDVSNIKMIHPRKGDLLFSRANTSEMVGATAIVDDDYEQLFLPDKLWRLDPAEGVNSLFLKYLLSTERVRAEISKASTGTSGSMQNISMAKFSRIDVFLPSAELQQQFADFAAQVDKSRFVAQQQIEKLQMLYDSLAQEYFGD